MILIATNARDLTADFVVLALERRQVPFVRINTESLPSGRIIFDPCLGERGWTVELGKRSIRFFDVLAGYLRRPEPPVPRPEVSVESQAYCAEEWSAVLTSALRSIGRRWLNPPLLISQAENKPKQLATAITIGLNVPETLVTNDFAKVREFVLAGPSVAKTLSSSLVVQGIEERAIFTTRIHNEDINDSGSISAAPIILQREINKQFDLRVTVVGNNVFAAEIHSQDFDETAVDWRKGTRPDLVHKEHQLADDVAAKCIEITRSFGLRFSAIDLILDRDGRYWFLELNPNGQWAWIERRVGLPISNAIAEELIGISKC